MKRRRYRKVANSSRPLIVAAHLVTYFNLLSKIGPKKYWKLIVAAATISDFTVCKCIHITFFNHNAYLYHVTVCKICKMCQALSTLLVLTNAALRFQSCLMGFCLYFNRFVDLGGTDRMLVGRRSDSRKYQQQYKQLRFCKQHVNNKYSN